MDLIGADQEYLDKKSFVAASAMVLGEDDGYGREVCHSFQFRLLSLTTTDMPFAFFLIALVAKNAEDLMDQDESIAKKVLIIGIFTKSKMARKRSFKPKFNIDESFDFDFSVEKERPVERKEIPSAPQKNSNTQQRKTRNYERKPGCGVYNEKRSAASGAAMTSETKALIAIGAIVFLAATVYIVSK